MLQNASLLAIVAVDTPENEPSKVGDAEPRQKRDPATAAAGSARNASTAPGRVRWAEAIEARRRSSVDSAEEGGWGHHAAGEGKDERRGSDSPYCEDRSSRYDDASDDASETRWVAVATGR